jgi:hypothetical protein
MYEPSRLKPALKREEVLTKGGIKVEDFQVHSQQKTKQPFQKWLFFCADTAIWKFEDLPLFLKKRRNSRKLPHG